MGFSRRQPQAKLAPPPPPPEPPPPPPTPATVANFRGATPQGSDRRLPGRPRPTANPVIGRATNTTGASLLGG